MKLKEYRQKNNISQKDLSKKLGIPPTTLYSYEQGVCDPNVNTLIKLADFYHVTIDELVGRPTSLINKLVLTDRERLLIDSILSMTDKQQELTQFYIDTLMNSV